MTNRLDRRLEARKKAYEQRRQAKQAKLDARREQYEAGGHVIGFGVGVSSIRKGGKIQKWVYKPVRERKTVIKPEIEEKKPLVDVFDEDGYLRISMQLSDISLPRDITIDEITDISFRHGVLEIRLRKRKKKLAEKEEKVLAKSEEEEITAEIKKKVLLLLKKRKIEEEAKEKFIL
ncbi:MAG: hypothetical protein QMC80_07855 [Thermoplasmatales archaeon]|nr:hypothetical protein [Thermoplasmatales archaeon]